MKKQIANDSTKAGQTLCLSIRQPWAWLIVNGWKNIENRTRRTTFRGRFLIHASRGMTRDEYEACQIFIYGFSDIRLPRMQDLPRGGIVGSAVLLDCVDSHASEWFTGPHGYVLADVTARQLVPFPGQLGFFPYTERTI
jgi:hypothetical protein